MKKTLKYSLLLTVFTLILFYFCVPSGFLFGSNTDWLPQHVNIADHFRKLFIANKTIFLDYSPLGGGSNLYSYAYYGYLRPDILIGCLLPTVPMKYIIMAYAILGVIVSVNLYFLWLNKLGFAPVYALTGSMLLACSACFFHSHMQIMFINYMPFLFAALLSIDYFVKTKKAWGITFSLFFVYLHSFYFSISCLAVCGLYLLYRTHDRKLLLRFCLSVFISIAMAGLLLLPTGLVILANKKDAGSGTSLATILGLNFSLDSLVYNRYGCGTSIICLYTLLLSLKNKLTRPFSLTLFLCFFMNIFSYLFNATLYVRGKILIPFLPLIILVCVTTLRRLMMEKIKHDYFLALLSSIPVFCYAVNKGITTNLLIMVLDVLVMVFFIIWTEKKPSPRLCYLLCIVPAILFIHTGRSDNYIAVQDRRVNVFSQEEIDGFYQDTHARFDCIQEPLANTNYLDSPSLLKTSVYSSTTNTLYSRFFYDIMKNPIRINNRVALIPDANPFFASLMGVRYLETHGYKVPVGYEEKVRKGDIVLAENTRVLPLAYASFNLYSQEDFRNLDFPSTLDTITNNTIIPENVHSSYQSQIKEYPLRFRDFDIPETIRIHPDGKGIAVQTSQETTLILPLKRVLRNQVLILSFDINFVDGKEFALSINGTKNKLSSQKAPYPNRNNTFTYMISSNTDISELTLTISKGSCTIDNAHSYIIDAGKIGNRDILPLRYEETKGKEVLKGTLSAEQNGYFVTSLPYENGYVAYLDGREIPVSIVNTAFVGFPLPKGTHSITLEFRAPGKTAGLLLSLIGFFLFFCQLALESSKGNIQNHHNNKAHGKTNGSNV